MSRIAWIVLGIVATAAFGYASYWVWLEVQVQIRGTFISSFGIFAAVIGSFVFLSLAQSIINLGSRIFARLSGSGSDNASS